MQLLILLFVTEVFAAAPNCKFEAFKAANPIQASTITQTNTTCMNMLQQYSNYLGFGKTASNGCSDWDWGDQLFKSHGSRIRGPGVFFDEIPDLDNPLARPTTSKEKFRLKIQSSTEAYQCELLAVTPEGARCILTVELTRPAGVSASPPTPATAPKLKKKKTISSKKKKGRSASR